MPWLDPRYKLVVCAALDLAVLVGLALSVAATKAQPLWFQLNWLVLWALLYLGLGWLFGSYTVLRWNRLARMTLLRRVLLTSVVSAVALALMRQIFNPSDAVWLLHRSTQVVIFSGLTLWSVLMRLLLRRGILIPSAPRCVLVGDEYERAILCDAWRLTPPREPLQLLSLADALKLAPPCVVAVGPSVSSDDQHRRLLELLESRDPRETILTTPLALAERQLERLPPRMVPEPWLQFSDLPANRLFSFERQLKRVSDLVVASVLLIVTSPLILLAMFLIWLEDRGPIFYVQKRTGWLGQTFFVYKLRTMVVSSPDEQPSWTQPGDRRITWVGQWLRRVRLDELPQLFNVLRGDMSLIGPRPERPEFEHLLEDQIPHYRKRHWMRPGLSGWAQVCAPYASSIEDSELKLSFDLYYLSHFSTWLDLIILLRTVKTVLKANGR